MPAFDPKAVIEGRTPGRARVGLTVGIVLAVICALAALGADLLESLGSGHHSVAPFLIALPFALLPVPLFVALVLLLDRLEPEPRAHLVFAFLWGAGVAALFALLINTAGLLFITQPALGTTNGDYISATFGAPVVEETLKGAFLFGMVWRRRSEFDGPTDGIIYAAMVGLGFAMMENIGYYIEALVRPTVGGAQLLGFTFVLRGVLSPFAHPIFTSMTGLGAAYTASHRRAWWALPLGWLGAMTLHGTWNGLSKFGFSGVAIAYAILFCVFIGLIVVLVKDRRRIIGLIWRVLPGYAPTGLVTLWDVQMLSTVDGRRHARTWARATGGRPAGVAMADYQLAATELALLHQRADRQVIDPGSFAQRQQALLSLMQLARGAFLSHQPEPPVPPWAAYGASGLAHGQAFAAPMPPPVLPPDGHYQPGGAAPASWLPPQPGWQQSPPPQPEWAQPPPSPQGWPQPPPGWQQPPPSPPEWPQPPPPQPEWPRDQQGPPQSPRYE
jgi:RsiW-degrading membrane proteinase PrsW (M82 family)